MSKSKNVPSDAGDVVPGDKIRVYAYGVGHGDCVLVELESEGRPVFRMLCDAGKDAAHVDELVSYLRANRRTDGIDLDVVALTHVDDDHQGGLRRLFAATDVTIDTYWGPCLPAFRRLAWLFPKRVQTAVTHAAERERELLARMIRVLHPMEGHVDRWLSGKVQLSVISPPARLLERLLYGTRAEVEHLVQAGSTPLEWLLAPAEPAPEQGETVGSFGARTFSTPADFEATFLHADTPDVATGLYTDESREPNFFGNRILNDTSLVMALDLWLDGTRRRRILLTGDQENWAYIASRHPAGLGIDVLKVPHHGGMVRLADKKDEDQDNRDEGVVEQAALWLKPRIALVSAGGTYGLPHTRVRDSLRATGAAVLCTNRRGIERITPPGAATQRNGSCFAAFECGLHAQPVKTVLTLSGTEEIMDRPACVQDSGGRGVAPIVVLTQRLVEPDEAFLRWTSGELERHAVWLKRLLEEDHARFVEKTEGAGLLAAMEREPLGWPRVEAAALVEGRRQFLSSPRQALDYARAREFVWSTQKGPHHAFEQACFHALPRPQEIDGIKSWIASMPNLLFETRPAWSAVVGHDKVALLQSSDTSSLSHVLAAMLHAPKALVQEELLPRLFVWMAEYFSFRVCACGYPYRHVEKGIASSGLLLHLKKRRGHVAPVPDLFDDEWTRRVFSRHFVNDELLEFLVAQAIQSAFIGQAVVFANGRGVVVRDAFKEFESEYEWGTSDRAAGVFQSRFENDAKWISLD